MYRKTPCNLRTFLPEIINQKSGCVYYIVMEIFWILFMSPHGEKMRKNAWYFFVDSAQPLLFYCLPRKTPMSTAFRLPADTVGARSEVSYIVFEKICSRKNTWYFSADSAPPLLFYVYKAGENPRPRLVTCTYSSTQRQITSRDPAYGKIPGFKFVYKPALTAFPLTNQCARRNRCWIINMSVISAGYR